VSGRVGVVPSRPWVSCHLILSTVFSGAEKVVVDELNTLDRGRFAPSLVCTEENAGAFRRRLKGDVRVVPIRSGKQGWARDPGLTLRVRRALREVSPRVLCCHNNSAWNLGLLLRPWLGWPGILATEHINLSGLGGQGVGAARSQKFQLYLWALRGLLRGRVRFVAVSSAVQEYLQSVYEIPDERISILENGIDTDDYPYSFRSRDDLRERLGMAPEEPLAVVVGRFDTQKGYIYFQEALRDLVARQPMLRVVYVGEGPLRAELQRDLDAKGLTHVVHFLGFVDDVKGVLANADLFVLPSLWEGLPIALLEAMSLGLPCVATAVDGTVRVIRDGEDGRLVPPKDSGALGTAIEATLKDRGDAEAMGRRGRARVGDHFDVHGRTRRLESLIEELA